MKRLDIFINKLHDDGSQPVWECYVQAVTRPNAARIISALEADGEHVAAFNHTKSLGLMAYETGEGWITSR